MEYVKNSYGQFEARINAHKYLKGIQGRLVNEVGTALEAYKTANLENDHSEG